CVVAHVLCSASAADKPARAFGRRPRHPLEARKSCVAYEMERVPIRRTEGADGALRGEAPTCVRRRSERGANDILLADQCRNGPERAGGRPLDFWNADFR